MQCSLVDSYSAKLRSSCFADAKEQFGAGTGATAWFSCFVVGSVLVSDRVRVNELVRKARELSGDERQAFLRKVCGADAELLHAVQQELAARTESGDIMQGQFKPAHLGENEPPAPSAGDRNLLVGIIALQLNFVTQDALVDAMNRWVIEKATPLEDILVAEGQLDVETQRLLTSLVQQHIDQHSGSTGKGLAAISDMSSVKASLLSIGDGELTEALARVRPGDAPTDAGNLFTGGLPDGGRFRVLRPHRSGGLGDIYVALDQELNREVALKEVRKEYSAQQVARERLRIEAEITGGLEHPNIVPVYALGAHRSGAPYYCMRFIKGDSLKDAIEAFHMRKGDLNASELNLALRNLLKRFVDVCDAVGYAHSRRVLHRDLKPGNIMLGRYGETLVVDWGLAKATGSKEASTVAFTETPIVPKSGSTAAPTMPGSTIGTPEYMSPEQAQGDIENLGPATDVYSLGATLHCLLVGQPPIVGESTEEKIEKVKRGEFERPRIIDPGVHPALEAICLKAMALQPKHRYEAAAQLADDIERWLADEPVAAYPDRMVTRVARTLRKNRTVAMVTTATVLVAMLGLLGINQVTRAKNREIENKNLALAEGQKKLSVSNHKLVETNSQLLNSQGHLRENVESFRLLTANFISKADEELSQEPGAVKLRDWLTKETLEIYQQYSQRLPESIQPDRAAKVWYAQLFRFHGKRKLDASEYESAIVSQNAALEILQEFLDANPDDPLGLGYSAETLADLAGSYGTSGKLTESLSKLDQAAKNSARLLEAHPDSENSMKLHARIQLARGGLLYELGRLQEAVQACQTCIDKLHPLSTAFQLDVQSEELLVLAFTRQSASFRRLQLLDQAAEACSKGFAVLEKKEDVLKRGERHSMARLLLERARVQLDANEAVAIVEPPLREAVKIWEELHNQFRESPQYQTFLAESHAELGQMGARENNKELAIANFEEAARLARLFGDSQPPRFEVSKSAGFILMGYSLAESQWGNVLQSEQLASEAQSYLSAAQALAPESQEIAQWLSELPLDP